MLARSCHVGLCAVRGRTAAVTAAAPPSAAAVRVWTAGGVRAKSSSSADLTAVDIGLENVVGTFTASAAASHAAALASEQSGVRLQSSQDPPSHAGTPGSATMTPAEGFARIVQLHEDSVPGPRPDDLAQLIAEAKRVNDVRRILHELVLPHPLFNDLLTGHGFRVLIFGKLLSTCTRLHEVDLVMEHLELIRAMGFTLTRSYCAVILDNMKRYVNARFQSEGRNPAICYSVLARCRRLRQMAKEDALTYDFVMHSRELHIAASVVSIYDRQNLYRSNFPPDDVPRREGIVVDWVVSHIERVPDYDDAVRETSLFVLETVQRAKEMNSRPTFSFMTRLCDYYFAVDDAERMLGVIEDCHDLRIDVAESVYAKFMQLACSFNFTNAPELMMRLRVCRPQCNIAAPDISRLLAYYGRAGGGSPCPECGEPFNHRNPALAVWERTPKEMRRCTLLHQARSQRGVLEDNRGVPQCRDNSATAFALWDMSQERAIRWGVSEWRFFLMCVCFSPRALEGVALLDANFPRNRWDEFVGLTYIRVLRFNEPTRIVSVLRQWSTDGVHLSPLALQQAIKGQLLVADDGERVDGLQFLLDAHIARDIYTTRYADRLIGERLDALKAAEATTPDAEDHSGLLRREKRVLNKFRQLMPRSQTLAEVKDSVSDVLALKTKRHAIYALS